MERERDFQTLLPCILILESRAPVLALRHNPSFQLVLASRRQRVGEDRRKFGHTHAIITAIFRAPKSGRNHLCHLIIPTGQQKVRIAQRSDPFIERVSCVGLHIMRQEVNKGLSFIILFRYFPRVLESSVC